MIRGLHGMLYSSDPDATRTFFRDVVRLPGTDIGEGWWLFDFPEGDLGVHPTDDPREAGTHDVSFWCDDIHGTVADLRARGATFTQEIEDHGYGLVTHFVAPGGIRVQLYEPRYVKGAARRRAARPAPAKKPARSTRAKATARRRAGARPTAKKRR